jgi:hypothetical protein
MRVSTRAKAVFAAEAARRGVSLVEFVDSLADAAWREQAGREFREARLAALENPEFRAELDEWESLDNDDDIPA